MGYSFEKYCKDYENIENYQKAKKDNFKGWECHHRLETHTSGGERLSVDISHEELKALGMYYNRPPEELIFLTTSEHNAFRRGRHLSEEHKKKIGAASKGNKNALGHHHTDEAKNKIAEAMKGEKNPFYGKRHSEETKKKIAEAKRINSTGRHWFNNGKENKFCYECPEGFVPGMLK